MPEFDSNLKPTLSYFKPKIHNTHMYIPKEIGWRHIN